MKSSLEVPYGLSEIREEVEGSLPSWLESLTAEARERREHLLAEVGLVVASSPRDLRVEVAEGRVEERMVVLPFRVWADGSDGRWPCFHSVVSAAWFGDGRTQLALEARYVPPEDLSRSEQTLLHRVVETVNRHLLAGIATSLEAGLAVPVAAPR